MKSRAPLLNLSIATGCWTLEEQHARGPISNPQQKRERSRSPKRHLAALLVGTWYSLIRDHSRALVSKAVNNKDLEQERAYIPRRHATLTGPTEGPDDLSDCTTDVNAFLARSSDEVHPKHLSPDERVAFDAADAAE